jgi:hypothetical protein
MIVNPLPKTGCEDCLRLEPVVVIAVLIDALQRMACPSK